MTRFSVFLALAMAGASAAAQTGHEHMQHGPVQATAGQADGESVPMAMHGALGLYPMSLDASGTSWQPQATPMDGIHRMYGQWMAMWHGNASLVYDHQGGPRGGDKTFAPSMLMGMGQRALGGGTLSVHAMVSLDPVMGKSGYPLLFQTGETADGRTPLVDRQHPHDLLMELSGSYSRALGQGRSAFVYVGLPGEPALGPTAFMHRFSGMDNPEAPLTHHWLDSTHITFGVVTAGYVWRKVKLEGSVFNGREPDQSRWNLEMRALDSYSARLTWNPTPQWSLQASHGRLASPELLEPEQSLRRTTASASYQHNVGPFEGQTTLAWGRNRKEPGESTNGYLLESALRMYGKTTVFGRFERVQNDELLHEEGEPHGQVFGVGKLSIGAVHDFAQLGDVKFGAGALASRYWKPNALDPVYGSNPGSWMVFVRAKLAMR